MLIYIIKKKSKTLKPCHKSNKNMFFQGLMKQTFK